MKHLLVLDVGNGQVISSIDKQKPIIVTEKTILTSVKTELKIYY